MSDEILIRRSLLVVPMGDREAIAAAGAHDADVVVIEPGDLLADDDADCVRATVADAIRAAGRGGAEVFLRLNPAFARAEIALTARRGLAGYVLPEATCAADVEAVDRLLSRVEARRGIAEGQFEIFLLIDTAKGAWDIRELVTASDRIRSVSLDEAGLANNLGIVAREDFDPFAYARGRIVVEGIAAGRQPIGIGHPLSLLPRAVGEDALATYATTARNTGFKGAFCTDPTWVAPLNAAFSPTAEQVAYYREVRKAFAAGIARGTAAVPYEGRMIDVPVDERARLMITLWEQSQRRDNEKAAARTAAGLASRP